MLKVLEFFISQDSMNPIREKVNCLLVKMIRKTKIKKKNNKLLLKL